MLDAKDVQLLGDILDQRLEGQDARFDQKLEKLERRIDDSINVKIAELREEMNRGFEKVRDDVIDALDQNIQPQLTSLAARVTRLERRVAAV